MREARLASAMISTPGHREPRRRQRGALPAWFPFARAQPLLRFTWGRCIFWLAFEPHGALHCLRRNHPGDPRWMAITQSDNREAPQALILAEPISDTRHWNMAGQGYRRGLLPSRELCLKRIFNRGQARFGEFRVGVSFFGPDRFDADDWGAAVLEASTASFERGSAPCAIALTFDPEPTPASLGGTMVAAAGGRPITRGARSLTTSALPDRYAINCAASVRAMPKS